jgi:DNA-binding GntR family transcriptional regulator
MGSFEVGTAEVSPLQPGIAQVSVGQIGIAEVGVEQVGCRQVKPLILAERIVRETELAEPEDTTTRENILAEAGYEQVYDIDEIITRMPTHEEVARLGIATGTPVAEHIRTGYTATDRPVRIMVSIIPGDTLILEYTIPT